MKCLIERMNTVKSGQYGKDFMKIKFSSDDDLQLNTPLKFHAMKIIIRSGFGENGKHYPQMFLDECFYEL